MIKEVLILIKKITDGIYKGQWVVRIQPMVNGKRTSITKRTDSKLEAQKIEIDLKLKYATYRPRKIIVPAITEDSLFLPSFTKFVERRAHSITATTNRSWSYALRLISEYLKYNGDQKIALKNLDKDYFNDFAHWYIATHPNASVRKSTVIDITLAHIRTFFESLLDKSVLSINPIPRGYLKEYFRASDFSVGRKWYLFSKEEFNLLRKELIKEYESSNVANSVSKLAILIDTYLGLRPEELQVLKFDQLVKYQGNWTFKINDSWSESQKKPNGALKDRPKGAYRYCLPIKDERVIKIIQEFHVRQTEYLEQFGLENTSGYIFLNLHNYRALASVVQTPIVQNSLNDMLKKACEKVGIRNSKDTVLAMYSIRVYLSTLLGSDNRISNVYACQRMGNTIQVFLSTYVKESKESYKENSEVWSC